MNAMAKFSKSVPFVIGGCVMIGFFLFHLFLLLIIRRGDDASCECMIVGIMVSKNEAHRHDASHQSSVMTLDVHELDVILQSSNVITLSYNVHYYFIFTFKTGTPFTPGYFLKIRVTDKSDSWSHIICFSLLHVKSD
jgi:hypothetical protein